MPPSLTRNPRVLVVDPDRDALQIFTAFLEHDAWVVLATGSADAAFRIARSAAPAVIVGEHPLYRSDGGRLCEDLRADPATAGIPFIAVTARVASRELEDALRTHPAGVAAKPVVLRELLGLVRAQASSVSSSRSTPSVSAASCPVPGPSRETSVSSGHPR